MLHPEMLLARLTGVLALLLLFGSVVAMVLAGPVKHPLAKKDATSAAQLQRWRFGGQSMRTTS